MKIKSKCIILKFALLFFFNTNAYAQLLEYNLVLNAAVVGGSAFGGVSVGENFQGSLTIESHILDNLGSDEGQVIVPLQDENDNFNLSYSIDVGNYTFTEQTVGSFNSEFNVFDSNIIIENEGPFSEGFSLEIGDSSFSNLDLGVTTVVHFGNAFGIPLPDLSVFFGTWSATDGVSGNVVSGSIAVNLIESTPSGISSVVAPSAVPVPSAVWLFASGFLGFVGLKRKKHST
jgi:hypothetical protein